jgi:hypothetical protein
LVNIAKETGANILEIESQLTDAKLKNFLIKRYHLTPGSHDWTLGIPQETNKERIFDKITIQLK